MGVPVALDLRVVRALRCLLEIDTYGLLIWRFFRLRRPTTIPAALADASVRVRLHANARHFKRRFLGYLRTVIRYHTEVRLESASSGLVLKPSPPHVAPRPRVAMKL
jgi:hypothetical protein